MAGCQAYEDGLYTAYRHLANEDVDFIYHYGDYIYENRGSPVRFAYDGNPRPFVRQHVGQEIHSLDDYRRRYAQYKLDADLQARYGARVLFIDGKSNAIFAAKLADVDAALAMLIAAAGAGELDAVLELASRRGNRSAV